MGWTLTGWTQKMGLVSSAETAHLTSTQFSYDLALVGSVSAERLAPPAVGGQEVPSARLGEAEREALAKGHVWGIFPKKETPIHPSIHLRICCAERACREGGDEDLCREKACLIQRHPAEARGDGSQGTREKLAAGEWYQEIPLTVGSGEGDHMVVFFPAILGPDGNKSQ